MMTFSDSRTDADRKSSSALSEEELTQVAGGILGQANGLSQGAVLSSSGFAALDCDGEYSKGGALGVVIIGGIKNAPLEGVAGGD